MRRYALPQKWLPQIVLVGLAGLAGCTGSGTTPPGAAGPSEQNGDALAPAQANGAASHQAAQQTPIIPKNARYTIAIAGFSGPGHEQQARAAKERLIQQLGRSDLHVVHDASESWLYLGYYAERDPRINPAEGGRVEHDLAMLKSIKDADDIQPYARSLVVPLPQPDPPAPADWNLANVDRNKPVDDPNRLYWTIAIAAYTNDARGVGADAGKDRKQLAVDTVAAARKQGIEAYFHHGPNISTVCIGAWPRKAIREQDENEARNDNDRGDVVVSSAELPKGMAESLERENSDLKVVQPKLDILDPSLLRTWQEYKEYSVNGEVQVNVITDPRTGRKTPRPQPSFLVQIPEVQKTSAFTKTMAGQPEQQPAQRNPFDLSQPVQTGGGQLRSIQR